MKLGFSYINFAKQNLNTNFSQHKNKVSFLYQDINDWKTDLKFDYVITKEVFEHTLNLSEALNSMYELLNHNGLILNLKRSSFFQEFLYS